jgi:predicted nicotinamide N-methyase
VWLATEAASGRREEPPFWAHAWPGGLALARHVLDAPELVRGKRVLDFAAGCGVAGIAAALVGAQVEATEVDAFALEAIAENAALNGVSLRARNDDVIDRDEGWDVVLVGDVFYEDELSRRVLSWLRALASRGAVLRVGDPGRSFFPSASMRVEGEYAFPPVPAWDSVVAKTARVWSVPA